MRNLLNKKLEALNFNKIEAKVYIELIKCNELNRSQIAKKINASRSAVYLPIEIYHHSIEAYDESEHKDEKIRLIMVIDLNYTLLCSTNNEDIEMAGTFIEKRRK